MVNEEFLKRENEMLNRHKGELIEKVWFLESENKRLRKALEFYADEAMYEKKLVSKSMCPQIEPDEYTPAYIPRYDKGHQARQALESGVNNG